MAFTLSVDSLADCTRDSERKQFEQALQEKNTELEHAYLAEDRLLAMDPHLMEAPKTHLWERDRLPNIKIEFPNAGIRKLILLSTHS